MVVTVSYYSYYKNLTGCASSDETVPDGATLADLYERVAARYPKLSSLRNSTLIAVGVDYQPRDYVLREGDEISLFPPVQGG